MSKLHLSKFTLSIICFLTVGLFQIDTAQGKVCYPSGQPFELATLDHNPLAADSTTFSSLCDSTCKAAFQESAGVGVQTAGVPRGSKYIVTCQCQTCH